MTTAVPKPRIRMPRPPRSGMSRAWVKCRTCGTVA